VTDHVERFELPRQVERLLECRRSRRDESDALSGTGNGRQRHNRFKDITHSGVFQVAPDCGEVRCEEEREPAAFRRLGMADACVDVGIGVRVDVRCPPRPVQVSVPVGQGHPEDDFAVSHVQSHFLFCSVLW
jgi:hypothetical protein